MQYIKQIQKPIDPSLIQILVACEHSGTIRNAFRALGFSAFSCDLKPSDDDSPWHIQDDVLNVLNDKQYNFTLMIAHPPCTHLAISGARWFNTPEKIQLQHESLEFVKQLIQSEIPHICIENPVSVISTKIRKPDQIIQPWQFGDSIQKRTCLWLKNLPKLQSTKIVDKGEFITTKGGKRIPAWYNLPESKSRSTLRSITPKGIANAMATQWSEYILNLYTI